MSTAQDICLPSALAGHTPDSVYAEWTDKQRETADRMEAEYNSQRSATLALADAKRGHTVRGMADDSLVHLARTYRRLIEDGVPPKRERLLNAQICDIEREQDFRSALAESWLASERGTHSYTAFKGRGGLAAVLHGDARPPSYDLAVTLDWEHWKRGLPAVLEWGER